MRRWQGWIATGWRTEAPVLLLAAGLAFGTLAWEEALHMAAAPAPAGSHLLRDALLLLPLAVVAAWWGTTSLGPRRHALPLTAARTAGAFTALLAPAAAVHTALDAADEAAVAHAEGPGGPGAIGLPGAGDSVSSALLHGATDALLALPVAFLVSLGALALVRRRGVGQPSVPRRRRLALVASTVLLAAAAALVPVSSAVSPPYAKFSQPLNIPPVLTGQDIQITMAQTEEQILPGNPTTMWTYNGSFPGPTIRRPTGVPTKVTFTNNLPDSTPGAAVQPTATGSMSVHHHGAQTSEDSDGHPARYLIPQGESRTYTYPAVENGAPERAAPQWYHDHRDMVTGRNDWMGLVGTFIYDDPVEQALDLPKGQYDVPLIVTDRTFDDGNQLAYVRTVAGNFGDVLLVNGVPQPYQEVADRRYRFRLYNVSNKRDYVFRLGNGQAMTQIGTESGLLPAPVSRTSIRLGPAERADVIVDFAGRLGQEIVLENLDAASGPGDRDGEVMQFRVTQDVTDDSSPVPASLRPVPQTDTPVVTRTWNFDLTGTTWTINGKAFDPDRVDAQPKLGTTERWVFRNPTAQPHLVHVHLGDQKLVTRNGQPPAPHERVKETWYVDSNDEVVVDVKFTDHVGKFVFHCHVLEHEDNAMMSQFQTLAPPTYPLPTPPAGGSGNTTEPPPALSYKVRILSSRKLRNVLRRGLRFEAASPSNGSTMRAYLSARGRRLGTLRRTGLSRGRTRQTLKLSRVGKARLRRLLRRRRTVRATLTVRAGNTTARARFTIRR